MATTEGGAAAVTSPGDVKVRRALLTVSDKRGIVDFARGLRELGVEIVSTGVSRLCIRQSTPAFWRYARARRTARRSSSTASRQSTWSA